MITWTKPFVHNDRFYEAIFLKNPFKEGLEAAVYHQGRRVKVKDLRSNEKRLLEQLKSEIDRILTR